MILFLTVEQVVAMHDRQLNAHGGMPGIRDRGAIDSIVARVENLHIYEKEGDLFTLAAAYLLSIARGHGFNDANKRTALLSALVFLSINGLDKKAPVSFASFVAEAAQGIYSLEEVATALSQLQ